jgi:hypothetical protein
MDIKVVTPPGLEDVFMDPKEWKPPIKDLKENADPPPKIANEVDKNNNLNNYVQIPGNSMIGNTDDVNLEKSLDTQVHDRNPNSNFGVYTTIPQKSNPNINRKCLSNNVEPIRESQSQFLSSNPGEYTTMPVKSNVESSEAPSPVPTVPKDVGLQNSSFGQYITMPESTNKKNEASDFGQYVEIPLKTFKHSNNNSNKPNIISMTSSGYVTFGFAKNITSYQKS